MGFFSFLSRKSHKEKSGNPLRSQNYTSTSLGALPVQGPYPAASNGSKVLESLARSRPETSQTQSSLATDREDPAPAPAVPRFREEFGERPSTAPNGSNPSPSPWNTYSNKLKKGTPRGAPPVSFRMFNKRTSQDTRPGSRGTDGASIASQQPETTPSHAISRSRASSLCRDKGRGYKDVLDAQSEINPTDFRARVKAAGARDYGEDVADRNLAQNRFTLEAPHVHAVYGQSSLAPALSRASRSEDALRHFERTPSLYDLTPGIRAQSLTSATHFPALNRSGCSQATLHSVDRQERASMLSRESPTCPDYHAGPRGGRSGQSVNTFTPAPQAMLGRTRSMDRTIRCYPLSKPGEIPRPTTSAEQSSHIRRPSSPRPNTNISAPILVNQPWVTKQGPVRPSMVPRDSYLLARQRADQASWDHTNDEVNYSGGKGAHVKTTERSYSLRSSSAHSSRRPVATAFVFPRKRHSLHTLQPSASSPVAAIITPFPPLASTREQQQSLTCPPTHSKQDKPGKTGFVAPSIPVPDFKPKASTLFDQLIPPPPSSAEPFTSHERSAPTTQQTGNGSRSLRASSVSSAATATVSDTSSNPFQRPNSRHTVNTSVDLSAPSPKEASRTSLHTPPPLPVLIDASVPALPTTDVSSPDSNNDFNIDDYVSSDDDSIAGSRHALGDGEEDLLFNDSGYGAGGMQLPGLFDSLALTPASRQTSQNTLQHQSSSPTLETPPAWSSGRRLMNYTGDSFGRAAGRRYIIDTGADDDEGCEYDIHDRHELDSTKSQRVPGAYPVEALEEEDDAEDEGNDDADSLYSRMSSSSDDDIVDGRRRDSVVRIRSPPARAVINRLSAIMHPDSRPMTPQNAAAGTSTTRATTTTTTTSQIPRPSSSSSAAHYRDPPFHKHNAHQIQAARYVAKTAVIEELESEQETGDGRGKPTTTTITTESSDMAQPQPQQEPAISTPITLENIEKPATTSAAPSTTLTIPATTKRATTPTAALQEEEKKSKDLLDETPKKNQVVYSAVDVLAAVKLRKETRAKNRAAGGTTVSKTSNRWSLANSLATNGYGYGYVNGTSGNNSKLGNDLQDQGKEETDERGRSTSSRPVSSVTVIQSAELGGLNISGSKSGRIKVKDRGRIVTDDDLDEDIKGLVQVGVREFKLAPGLTSGEQPDEIKAAGQGEGGEKDHPDIKSRGRSLTRT